MIHRIAGPDDPRLDPYRHVADPGWLRRHGLFVAEGRLVFQRLVALGRYEVVSVLVNRSASAALGGPLAAIDGDVFVCEEPVLRGVTGYNFHRGCLALVRRPPPSDAGELLSAARLLGLEGVGNPDNVGGLFRAAAALGAGGVLLGPGTGDPLYRKAVRTSMGAVLRVPFAQAHDWPAALGRVRARGFRIVALTPEADALPLAGFARQTEVSGPLILLLGSEGAGLRAATLAHADVRVRIPIAPDVDSLNVVVAAAIALDRLR